MVNKCLEELEKMVAVFTHVLFIDFWRKFTMIKIIKKDTIYLRFYKILKNH